MAIDNLWTHEAPPPRRDFLLRYRLRLLIQNFFQLEIVPLSLWMILILLF